MLSKEFYHGQLFQETISDQRHANFFPMDIFWGVFGSSGLGLEEEREGTQHVLFNFSHLFNRILVQCLQVTVILEIMVRKCGFSAVESVTPDRYRSFVKSVVEVAFPFLRCWLISKNFSEFLDLLIMLLAEPA